jgi:hypothetical protein
LNFANLEVMIKSLLIGHESDIQKYSQALSQSQYFKSVDLYSFADKTKLVIDLERLINYDAIFLISRLPEPYPFFSECIKTARNLYFTDQPDLSDQEVNSLEQLYNESGCLLFSEIIEINHPLVEEFIAIEPGQLHYSYCKSIAGKKDIRPSLLTALAFLSLLSPMPVKKMDVNTIETSSSEPPSIKVRLKMYDSSVCSILLKIDNKSLHNLVIESSKGNFLFNLEENYLENIHGTQFHSEEVTSELLLHRTLNSFALNIILNTSPIFSFSHYLMVTSLLQKIGNILKNSI